jgi:acylphosphatase
MATAILCNIHGRVQGVGYRAWTIKNAQKLGLTGWARNRTDGTVEALFCGEEEPVEEMIQRCHEGPLAARVQKVERKLADIPPPRDFTQLPTE